jgi:RNA polymerase sigma-70 factor (ECF subfamily)
MTQATPLTPEALNQRLSQITTTWTAVFQAHASYADQVGAAQRQLLQRYSPAIYRYLLGAVRSPDVADELFQEFALRLVRGDFKRADPERGRFRDFLKTTLYHLIVDHQRRQQRQLVPLAPGIPEPAVEPPSVADSDREFLAIWRAELMERAWEGLARLERETGQPLHTVLRLRTDNPDLRSPQMAEQLTARLAQPVTAEWVRKRLFLAREKFTDLLLQEIELSLGSPTESELEQELIDLGLLASCQAALARRRG